MSAKAGCDITCYAARDSGGVSGLGDWSADDQMRGTGRNGPFRRHDAGLIPVHAFDEAYAGGDDEEVGPYGGAHRGCFLA